MKHYLCLVFLVVVDNQCSGLPSRALLHVEVINTHGMGDSQQRVLVLEDLLV